MEAAHLIAIGCYNTKEAKSSAKGGFCLFCGPGRHHNDAPRSYHLKVTNLVQRNILQFP